MPELTEHARPAPDISAYLAPLAKIDGKVRDLSPEIERRQEKILRQLPPISDLVQRLYGHLQAAYTEGDLRAGRSTEHDERARVAGELAEILVTAESSLFSLVLGDRKLVSPPEKGDKEASEKLLGVLHHPKVLHLEKEVGRNPDLAWFDIEKRTVKALGEVKLTKKLDARSFRQLGPLGFENNLKTTIAVLNARPELGKEVFGIDPETGEVLRGGIDPDVAEIVFLPRDTEIKEENRGNLILSIKEDPVKGLDEKQVKAFLKLMKEGKVRLALFSFSRKEIDELSREIMARIKTKYPKLNPEVKII